MEWDELTVGIQATPPQPGELVYLARTGTDYTWFVVSEASPSPHSSPGQPAPDTWIYYSGPWHMADAPAFFADLRAEMESMAGGADRCRWPLDQPWPHGH